MAIIDITFFTKKNRESNEKIKKLLEERFQCPVKFSYRNDLFGASVWCDTSGEGVIVQKKITKYFNTIKE